MKMWCRVRLEFGTQKFGIKELIKVKLRPLFDNETNVSSVNPSSETWALLSFYGDWLFRYQIFNYLNPSQDAVPSSPQPNDACPEFWLQ